MTGLVIILISFWICVHFAIELKKFFVVPFFELALFYRIMFLYFKYGLDVV
jgi:hypothetical protein